MLKVILVTFVLKGRRVKLPRRGISASKIARNKIPTATPMFSGSMVLSKALQDENESQKFKMAAEIM